MVESSVWNGNGVRRAIMICDVRWWASIQIFFGIFSLTFAVLIMIIVSKDVVMCWGNMDMELYWGLYASICYFLQNERQIGIGEMRVWVRLHNVFFGPKNTLHTCMRKKYINIVYYCVICSDQVYKNIYTFLDWWMQSWESFWSTSRFFWWSVWQKQSNHYCHYHSLSLQSMGGNSEDEET